MQISENYRLEIMPLNIVLLQKRSKEHRLSKKDIPDAYAPIAYFSKIKPAFEYIVDNMIIETGFDDLKKIVEKQDELYKLIEKVCPNITTADLKSKVALKECDEVNVE